MLLKAIRQLWLNLLIRFVYAVGCPAELKKCSSQYSLFSFIICSVSIENEIVNQFYRKWYRQRRRHVRYGSTTAFSNRSLLLERRCCLQIPCVNCRRLFPDAVGPPRPRLAPSLGGHALLAIILRALLEIGKSRGVRKRRGVRFGI